MHPWLLTNPPVSMYGVCLVAALVVAWVWARVRAKRAGVDASRVDLMMPVLVGTGLLGAWGFGWLTDALTGEAVHGAVLVGSLLVALAAGIAYAIFSGIALGVLGDICAAPLALGIGIGRVGCFFAGCCFGKVCDGPAWLTAVRFPAGSLAFVQQLHGGLVSAEGGASLPVYPVQLYESSLSVLLAVGVWRWRVRDERGVTGQKFLAMGLGYAALRFGMEFLRGDNPLIGGLTFSQWGAMLIAAMAAGTWWVRWRHAEIWGLRRGLRVQCP